MTGTKPRPDTKTSAQPTGTSWRTRVFARLHDWSHVDARSLAAFRIVVATLLLVDLALRWPMIELFYSNRGLLTNHYLLFMQPGRAVPSLLVGIADPFLVGCFFVAAAIAYTALLLGWHTKTAQILSFVAILSLNTRNPLVLYGGDIVLHLFLIWTWFLPLGERWSVDAVLRAHDGRGVPPRAHLSFAEIGIVVQLSVIYLFNALNKTGTTWHEGTALHYLFWQDAIARGPALWLREHAPFELLWTLSWATLVIELAGAVLLLIPFRVRLLRWLVLPPLAVMHVGIFATAHVNLFSWVMIATYALFLRHEDWDALASWMTRGRSSARRWLARALEPRSPGVVWTDPAARVGLYVREALAAVWLVVLALGCLTDNAVIPASVKARVPTWHQPVTASLLAYQGWGMFAPEAPTEEGWFVVEARTQDGRLVDPFTMGPPRERLDPGFGGWIAQERIAYSIRARQSYFPTLRVDLERFLWGSHVLAGRGPADAIVSYEAYNLTRQSPKPGATEAPPTRKVLLAAGTRPAQVPLPPLP